MFAFNKQLFKINQHIFIHDVVKYNINHDVLNDILITCHYLKNSKEFPINFFTIDKD